MTRAVLCALLLMAHVTVASAADWKEEKGEHFIVYYAGKASFAAKIRYKAEQAYRTVTSDLGYTRSENFWQWDKRVKIYVYPDAETFRTATGEPAWSQGVANYTNKAISTFAESEGFVDGILPHEITHLVFRDFVGFKGEVPLWLDEGVAQWEEPAKRALAKKVARFLVERRKAYPLRELTSMDIRGSSDEETVHYFYMQSVSLVDFLVRRQGARSFTAFCRELRDGKALDDALKAAYPASLSDLDQVEKEWKKYALAN